METNGYALGAPVGSGTSSTVHAGTVDGCGCRVVVKVVAGARAALVREEVRVWHGLRHANVARLLHVVEVGLGVGLVLESAGRDLFTEVVASGGLGARPLRRRLRGVVDALRYLHAAGVVHGDVKLENVCVDDAGVVRLVDFGCARVVGDARAGVAGTLQYLSPEVARGATGAFASDMWALGVLMYTAVTGWYPFDAREEGMSDGEADAATRTRIVSGDALPIPQSMDIPSDIRRMIAALLAKDPVARPTADAVALWLSREAAALPALYVPRARSAPKSCTVPCCAAASCKVLPAPASPTGTSEAAFYEDGAVAAAGRLQTCEEALRVVDGVVLARKRAAFEVSVALADMAIASRHRDSKQEELRIHQQDLRNRVA